MARTSSLSYEQRVAVYLDFRRLGKVYPVSNLHRKARSTVSGVVKFFVDSGFAPTPRIQLPRALASRVQEEHLQDVAAQLRTTSIRIPEPSLYTPEVRYLAEEDGSDRLELKWPAPSPSTQNDLDWHLRSTPAEEPVRRFQETVRDLLSMCTKLWLDLAEGLEQRCNAHRSRTGESSGEISVRPYRPGAHAVEVTQGFIPHEAVSLVYRHLLGAVPAEIVNVDRWRPSSGDPAVLMAGVSGVAVAVGRQIHSVVRMGASQLIEEAAVERERAGALQGVYRDVSYLAKVVTRALAEVSEKEINRGICPACPYPELSADLNPAPKRRSGKKTD